MSNLAAPWILLTLFQHDGTHGYEIKKRIGSYIKDMGVGMNITGLYRHLNLLEGRGMLRSEWDNPEKGKPPQYGAIVQGYAEGGGAPYGVLNGPIGIEELAADRPGFRTVIHELNHRFQGSTVDHRVRIEEHHVPPGAQTNGLIIGRGKSPVPLIGYEEDIGKEGIHHLHRSIGRGVVHDQNLKGYPPGYGIDGFEALPQRSFGIPVHDADRQVNQPIPLLPAVAVVETLRIFAQPGEIFRLRVNRCNEWVPFSPRRSGCFLPS